METAPLKSFATWARRELITQVNARLTAVLAPASPERIENPRTVSMLERDITAAGNGTTGREAIADRVAYTWFNRLIALRFMDANGYTGVGVVSPAHGQHPGQPEILADAKRGIIDHAVVSNQRTLDTITGLLYGTRPSTDEIPAATQLFTPHWIVRYLVENSVGRLWMLNHPSSRLVEQMDYYIAPVDDETDFLKISIPEDLTVIETKTSDLIRPTLAA